MAKYVIPLQDLGQTYFTTLTVPNCTKENLRETCLKLIETTKNIVRVLREKRLYKFSGIRKLEITYNPSTDTYHPHLHLLVDKNVGNIIVDEWLKRMPDAKREGWDYREKRMVPLQVVQKADENVLKEIFKYTTKIIVSKKGEINVYIKPLNKILEVLYKRRCFQPFGIIKMVSEEVDKLDSQVYEELKDSEGGIIEWKWKDCDWINDKNTLTGYVPPDIEFNFFDK